MIEMGPSKLVQKTSHKIHGCIGPAPFLRCISQKGSVTMIEMGQFATISVRSIYIFTIYSCSGGRFCLPEAWREPEKLAIMDWLEALPAGCPPRAAKDIAIEAVYRVVTCASPTMEDFKSHAALKLPLGPGCDPCEWASCSLFKSRDRAVDIASKLPKIRFSKPHLALLDISLGDGKSKINQKTSHIHFWASTQFDPASALIEVEKL
jgi:hypothetical protein